MERLLDNIGLLATPVVYLMSWNASSGALSAP